MRCLNLLRILSTLHESDGMPSAVIAANLDEWQVVKM